MHDEAIAAGGSQSPELLAVVGSEALDAGFPQSETEDVDLDFGDDLEAEEAEQEAEGLALSLEDREISPSPGVSPPSKPARSSTAASRAPVARWGDSLCLAATSDWRSVN